MRNGHTVAGFALSAALGAVFLTGGPAGAATFITFDIPGAKGIQPTSINNKGEITGNFLDQDDNRGGFVRDSSGAIEPFGVKNSSDVEPHGINEKGKIVGTFLGKLANQCFFQKSPGHALNCSPLSAQNTDGNAVNASGEVVGDSQDGSAIHGFTWDVQNGADLFDAPGAIFTEPQTINDLGVIAGFYSDANRQTHAFIRDAAGTITSFDVPGASATVAHAVNLGGTIAGIFFTSGTHGFVLDPGSTCCTVFDPKGSTSTLVFGINKKGVVVGVYNIGSGTQGYERLKNGKIIVFDAPGATDRTNAFAINDSGEITGAYDDSNGEHGYLRIP
jgi:uncharacterized membrane protein